jgi:hypothetical protein
MKIEEPSIQDILDALPFYILLVDSDQCILAAGQLGINWKYARGRVFV